MTTKVNLKITGANLKGIKNLQINLKKLQDIEGKVGVFGGNYPTGESVPQVAMLHEFGSLEPRNFQYKGENIKIKGIPTRSFLRMPLHAKRFKIVGDKEFLKAYVIDSLKSGYVDMPLEYMTKRAEAIVQEAFDTQGYGQWDRNMSKAYIALKGSDTPLIDTGRLRQSVTSIVGKRGTV